MRWESEKEEEKADKIKEERKKKKREDYLVKGMMEMEGLRSRVKSISAISAHFFMVMSSERSARKRENRSILIRMFKLKVKSK